jgi:hypothetical protein
MSVECVLIGAFMVMQLHIYTPLSCMTCFLGHDTLLPVLEPQRVRLYMIWDSHGSDYEDHCKLLFCSVCLILLFWSWKQNMSLQNIGK